MGRAPGPDRQGACAVAVHPPVPATVPLSREAPIPADLADLLEAGQLKPVIDRTYPLSAAADALRYVGAGHTRGKVVITV